MNLDAPRWSELDHALAGETEIRRLLAAIDEMARWDAGDNEEGPWVTLQRAVYDFGNVREAAYAVVPHVVGAAQTRRPGDQVVALEFVLDIALGKLAGSAPIPRDLLAEYCESIRVCTKLAEGGRRTQLRIGSARIVVCAWLLAGSRVRAADLLYRINTSALEVECPKCDGTLNAYVELENIELCHQGGPSAQKLADSALLAPEIGEILAAGTELGEDDFVRAVALLDATYACPLCGASFKPIDRVRPALRDTLECNG